jgi:energy-converting hydrogenase Eha subunit B
MPFLNAFTFRSRSSSPRPGSRKGEGHLDADKAYAAAITALGITKEVGGLLKDIPYVKGVAGVVLQIIKIGDVSDHTSSRLL